MFPEVTPGSLVILCNKSAGRRNTGVRARTLSLPHDLPSAPRHARCTALAGTPVGP
ncbi:hypothetical protein CO2235_40002 [Cupriavidus oxalaticus]|uniref:Uncharacterized protein n=1 Tax=Cupriavidus oxalaticus TaxID=96344 RepID=A0A375GD52_9BURK|nr:hypothetical protein CO2235_40002 [Cupriavidus oxalaticus]